MWKTKTLLCYAPHFWPPTSTGSTTSASKVSGVCGWAADKSWNWPLAWKSHTQHLVYLATKLCWIFRLQESRVYVIEDHKTISRAKQHIINIDKRTNLSNLIPRLVCAHLKPLSIMKQYIFHGTKFLACGRKNKKKIIERLLTVKPLETKAASYRRSTAFNASLSSGLLLHAACKLVYKPG